MYTYEIYMGLFNFELGTGELDWYRVQSVSMPLLPYVALCRPMLG